MPLATELLTQNLPSNSSTLLDPTLPTPSSPKVSLQGAKVILRLHRSVREHQQLGHSHLALLHRHMERCLPWSGPGRSIRFGRGPVEREGEVSQERPPNW